LQNRETWPVRARAAEATAAFQPPAGTTIGFVRSSRHPQKVARRLHSSLANAEKVGEHEQKLGIRREAVGRSARRGQNRGQLCNAGRWRAAARSPPRAAG
jgi:hypothetical protein